MFKTSGCNDGLFSPFLCFFQASLAELYFCLQNTTRKVESKLNSIISKKLIILEVGIYLDGERYSIVGRGFLVRKLYTKGM